MTRFTAMFLVGSALLSAGPLVNGGFESPAIVTLDFATVPTGWTKLDPSCGSDNCAGSGLFLQTYSTFGLPTAGGEGTQAFGFGGNGVTTGSLRQTFDTVIGNTYQISFQYVIQQGVGAEDFTVEALDGSTVLGTESFHFSNTAWLTQSLSFQATSLATTLRFTDTSGLLESAGDHASTNWALDAVTVTSQGPGGGQTPEPGAMWLTGAGLIAVGLIQRRVRAAVSDRARLAQTSTRA